MALANTFGRLCAGTASDYLGRLPTLGAGLGIAIIGLILLALGSPANTLPFYCGLIALGFSFGCFMGVYPALQRRFSVQDTMALISALCSQGLPWPAFLAPHSCSCSQQWVFLKQDTIARPGPFQRLGLS